MVEAAASFYLSYCNFGVRYSVILVDAWAIYLIIKFINKSHR